jgi:hypothetical protein
LISIRLNNDNDNEAKNLALARLEAVFGQGLRQDAVKRHNPNADETTKHEADEEPPYETTITVNYNGGGHLKDASLLWNLDSIAAAVAAFPQKVEETPQRI